MNENWVTWQQLRKLSQTYLSENICLKVTFHWMKHEQTIMIDSSTVSPLKFMTLVIWTSVERSRYGSLRIIKREAWAICSTKMRYLEREATVMRGYFTFIVESVVLCSLSCSYKTFTFCFSEREKKKIFSEWQKEKGEIFWISKGNTSLPLKNGSFPWDMLVLSVMTLSVDLLRQIATDPHGFSRAHSIGNGLFNFPQGALLFPRYASLKRHPLCVYAVKKINK